MNLAIGSLAIFAAGLLALAIFHPGWTRWLALAVFLPGFLWCFYVFDRALGYAKPGLPAADAQILWHAFNEPYTIFVLISENGIPRLRTLPWSIPTAQAIQNAGREAAGGRARIMLRGSNSGSEEEAAWAAPQEANPPKL